ncbi:unnamed protein product [Vitrella brassicaformis CCMP3155]|uniref:Potassium channel tetramerisation-type BTB domain-containing protein n=1 Tax=Vitrella brassicaformis (strain CCMP3155) TaxID=1169540 RepID=A0A0G4FQT7_VITBC|nr:unnamed protein product [Vitrella brassicaformis CCMP3155]|eukprot:CEM16821.1 unnamed protein product [Vitrella brassicaformis CCMP3155]
MQAELSAQKFSVISILNQLHVPTTKASDAVESLHKQIKQADDDAQQERQKHGASDPSKSSPDDVLLLKVGGYELSVKRQRLTQGGGVEGTLLATLFGGSWDGRFVKLTDRDKKERMFVDMDSAALKVIHNAILDARTIRSATHRTADTQASISHLLEDARRRNFTGLHDFWIKKMLSPIDSAAAGTTGDVTNPRLSANDTPNELSDFVKAADAFVKAFAAEKARLEGELAAAKRRYENLGNEIKALTPFLAPLNGEDPIRSVKVCGESIATTQSTVDEMSDKLRNRFDMWSRPVEDVQPEHVSRMVDHYRRKRLGASAADMAAVLTMASATEQHAFDANAFMYGLTDESPKASKAHQTFGGLGQVPSMQQRRFGFAQMSNGVQYKIVQQGSGPKPTRDQRIKYDIVDWRDDFDGQDKICEDRGREYHVSSAVEWWQELFTDMRVGEVRRCIVPATPAGRNELYIEYKLVSITS